MARYLLLLGFCFAAMSSALADDVAPSVAASVKPAATLSGRKKIEALLQSPAQLDLGNRQSATVKELLGKLHDQHQLSIRFDVPTLTAMLGGNSSGAAKSNNPSSSRAAAVAIRSPSASVTGSGIATISEPRTAAAGPSVSGGSSIAPPTASNAVTRASATAELTSDSPQQSAANAVSLPAPFPGQVVPAKPQPPAPLAPPPPVADVEVTGHDMATILDSLLQTEVDIRSIDLKTVSIATVLRHALGAFPNSALGDDEASGMPIVMTDATLFDYLVEDDGLQITTRLKALTYKETRVYSIKRLANISPDQLATVIRQSVRPWSWRSRIDDLGDKLKAGTAKIPPKLLGNVIKSGLEFASLDIGAPLNAEVSEKPSAAKDSDTLDAEQLAMIGGAVVNGLVTFTHASLTVLEIMHYADPPTGSIQTLPGKLIITQSQTAHREIADLMKQLEDE